MAKETRQQLESRIRRVSEENVRLKAEVDMLRKDPAHSILREDRDTYKSTNDELIRENAKLSTSLEVLRKDRASSNFSLSWSTTVTWLGIFGCCYCFYLSVNALAGKTTLADIGINVLGSLKLTDVLAGLFGAGGGLYGARERRLRKKTTEQQRSQIKKLEEKLNPNRGSSGLTDDGGTDPGDV